LRWIWKQRDIADWRKIITFNWKKQVFERNSIFVKLKCLGYKSINLLARIRNVDTKISSSFDKKWKPLFTPTTSDHWNIKKFFSIFFLWSVCHIIQNSCFCDSLIRRILIQVRPWDWSNLSPSSNCAFFQSRIFYSHHSITTWSDIILSKPKKTSAIIRILAFLISHWPSSIVLDHTCFWLFSVIQEHIHVATFYPRSLFLPYINL